MNVKTFAQIMYQGQNFGWVANVSPIEKQFHFPVNTFSTIVGEKVSKKFGEKLIGTKLIIFSDKVDNFFSDKVDHVFRTKSIIFFRTKMIAFSDKVDRSFRTKLNSFFGQS
jgi:hypothetical protein